MLHKFEVYYPGLKTEMTVWAESATEAVHYYPRRVTTDGAKVVWERWSITVVGMLEGSRSPFVAVRPARPGNLGRENREDSAE